MLVVWALRADPLRDDSTELINAGPSDIACAYISCVHAYLRDHVHTLTQASACKHAYLCHGTYHCLMLQENAEDREAVADKLASAQAWLADLRKQQKELNVKRDLLARGASSSEHLHWFALMWDCFGDVSLEVTRILILHPVAFSLKQTMNVACSKLMLQQSCKTCATSIGAACCIWPTQETNQWKPDLALLG